MKWDGEWHITYEVFRDLGVAFAAVLVLIYILVVGWFQSFLTPLAIMLAIPFSLVGILPAHAALGAFFTATSMIGFIAGAGIVVRNSIILVDFIELRIRDGMSIEDAVIDAGAVRFRPMALTAAAMTLPRFAIAQADQRPAITVAVQKLANSNVLEPLREQSNVGTRVSGSFSESLVDIDWIGDLALRPRLAESWRRIDHRTVEFTLRQGARFHDGRPVTAEDVVFSWNKFESVGPNATDLSYKRSPAAPIESVTRIDNSTVQFKLAYPWSPLTAVLATGNFFIEPRGTVDLKEAADAVGLAAYLFTCGLIIGIGEAMRSAQERAAERQLDSSGGPKD